jgi:hypothetical protein
MTMKVQVDLTHAVGGYVTAVRFTPDSGERRALVAWLKGKVFAHAIAQPGVLGAMAAENDANTAGAANRTGGVAAAEWLVLIEGSDAKATAAIARGAFKLAALKRFGVSKAPAIGSYQFLSGVER